MAANVTKGVHEANISYLTNSEVRRRFQIAVWCTPWGMIAPVSAIETAKQHPAGMRWLAVDSGIERDGSIVWSAGGWECTDNPTLPIVLGEVA